MITLLVPPSAFGGDEVEVAGAAYRHLFRARRAAVGEEVRVVDGAGRARRGEVARVDRARAVVRLAEPAPSGEPGLEVVLLVAAPRPERAAWTVEKATELGVAAVRFLRCERAPRLYGAVALARLQRVAAAAVEQCGRSRLPAVTGMHELAEAVELAAGCDIRWLLDPRAAGPPEVGAAVRRAAILVGPEGGFSPGEGEALRAAGWRPGSLGPRVLRTETAAVAAAALLLCR